MEIRANLLPQVRGWRGQLACIDAAHRVHARIGDAIRTGKDRGIGKFPSTSMAMNKAWLAAALTSCRPVVQSAHQVPSSLGGMPH